MEPPTILVVDDDRDLRVSLCEALEDEGYRTVEAPDGRAAFERMREHRPDVIVLDLVMPGMNGWQFRREQLLDPEFATIPVIVLTSMGPAERPGIDANALIFKPVTLDQLLEVVALHASVR